MSGRHGQQLKPSCLHLQVVGLAGVDLQAIQAGQDAGASGDEAMDQGGESDGDDSSEGSDGPDLYEEGNDVRGCSSCPAFHVRPLLLVVASFRGSLVACEGLRLHLSAAVASNTAGRLCLIEPEPMQPICGSHLCAQTDLASK